MPILKFYFKIFLFYFSANHSPQNHFTKIATPGLDEGTVPPAYVNKVSSYISNFYGKSLQMLQIASLSI